MSESLKLKNTAPFILTSDNPQDKLKEITDKLQEGIKNIFDSTQYKEYLKTVAKFHNYSFNNCLLISLQKPDATLVGGYTFWRDEMNRSVMSGEKGIKIIAPAPIKKTKKVNAVDENGKPMFYPNGKRITEEQTITIPAFKVVTIFDVSQTDGEPLPEVGKAYLTGSVEQYKDFYDALVETSPVPVSFKQIDSKTNGYYDNNEKCIVLNEGMSELQNLKTLIHEIAHARLHDNSTKEPKPDRKTKEVEAESIAYTVCQHYGLDTSEYSFAYIATWSGDKELNTLKASLDTIRKESNTIITKTNKNFEEIQKERLQYTEHPHKIKGLNNLVNNLDDLHKELTDIDPNSHKGEETYKTYKEIFRVAEAQVPGGYKVVKDLVNHLAQSKDINEMKDRVAEVRTEFEKRLPVQMKMEQYSNYDITKDKEAMINKIMAHIVKDDPEHPIKSLRYIERNMRRKSVDEIRDIDYKFYFPKEVSQAKNQIKPSIKDQLMTHQKQLASQKNHLSRTTTKSNQMEV